MQSHSVRRVQALLDGLGGTRYLEIGVEYGKTLFDVKAETRHAVDPNFRFDPRDREETEVQFYPVTSDSFFSVISPDVRYDVIFLDGLHQFEQTYRDFCNSLSHSHPRTVILIDDVLPTDVFGALRQHPDAIRFREAHGLSGVAWFGDVYKIVFSIHDFHTTLNFRTIVGGEHAQTVVWRGGREPRRPIFDSMESISRLTWFDMRGHMEFMHPASEEEVLAEVLQDLTPDIKQGAQTRRIDVSASDF